MKGKSASQKTKRATESLAADSTRPQSIQDAVETPHVENGTNNILGRANQELRRMETPTEPTEIEVPDFFDVEERLEHAAHPLRLLCPECQEIVRELERAAFVLKYQPIFHFFSDEQLLKMEDYLTGEDRDTMKLPAAPNASNPQQQRFANSRGGIPWLKNEHLDATPREATILDSMYDPNGNFGEQVVVKISFGPNRNFRWGLRLGKKPNPNYAVLVNHFGDDSDAWKGQKFMIGLEQDPISEQEFPTVVGFCEQQSKKKG